MADGVRLVDADQPTAKSEQEGVDDHTPGTQHTSVDTLLYPLVALVVVTSARVDQRAPAWWLCVCGYDGV